jgi:hypothetical protein
MSVGAGFMIRMPAAPTDTTTAVTSGEVVVRRRGKSKAPNFTYEGPVSVIRLQLDVSDPVVRGRLERQWGAVFGLRRALQRDATHRCRAYWAAHRERHADPKALRVRLGLSRKGIEAAAKSHIEASGWMHDHLTKAVGLHVADEVWETVDRHLFGDACGRRHGPARVGSWRDFTRIPGRARSHTKTKPVWETWRLVGSLDGPFEGYRDRQLPVSVSTAFGAAGQPAGTSILCQPASMPAPTKPTSGSWWDHDGALAVVFTGLPGGDAVIPVRLPRGAGQWAHLSHFLADPSVWHKIDLVRVRDRKAPGGWRYYAHLLVHQGGYQSPLTRARRAEIPAGRRGGVDANVSNLALASYPTGHPELPPYPGRSRRRGPPHKSGQTRPRRRHRRADSGVARQHHHDRRLPDLDLGEVVGQTHRPVQSRHAGVRARDRVRRHRRPAVSGRHPIHRDEPALPVWTPGRQDPRPAYPRLSALRAAW